LNGLLSLFLSPHKENCLACRGNFAHRFVGVFDRLNGFLQINNVNPISLRENELFHSRIPAFYLMPKMHARLQQALHGNYRQFSLQ
jgi:hypothetical protein